MFDWSVLNVDGHDLGSKWSALWAEPHRHQERQLEIDAWISQWSTWVDRVSDPTGYAAMRSRGIQLRLSATDPHQALVSVRRPPLTTDPKEALWRLTWGLRGDEWLVTAIDHGSAGRDSPLSAQLCVGAPVRCSTAAKAVSASGFTSP
ncbi:MAG: hypothetical protein EXR77_13060 [Myxococcales bacterium]|nr:hypothetical protein [Myxococcales bacterium]